MPRDAAPEARPDPGAEAALSAPTVTAAEVTASLQGLDVTDAGLATVLDGRVHLLSLAPFKVRLGPRWDAMQRRIHDAVQTELKARLGRRDLFTRHRDDGYVLVFGEGSEAEATLRASLITDAILARLFGNSQVAELRGGCLHTVGADAEGRVATHPVADTETLLDRLESGLSASPSGAEAPASDPALSKGSADGPDAAAAGEHAGEGRMTADRLHGFLKQLRELEGQLTRRLDELVLGGGSGRPEIALNAGLIRVVHRSLDSLRALEERTEARLQALEAGETEARAVPQAEAAPATPELAIRFRPFWHVPSSRVAVYAAEAQLTATAALMADAHRGYDDDLQEAIDRLLLLQSRKELEQARSQGTPAIVAIPVHYRTLVRIGSRRRYLDLCRNIRDEDRRYILWLLQGLPRQAFGTQLHGFVEELNIFGRSLSVMLTLTEQTVPHLVHDLAQIALAGVAAVGLDVREAGTGESDLIKLFDHLAKVFSAARLKSFVTGLETNSQVLAAACAGFDHVAGPAVAEAVEGLDGVLKAPLETVYLHHLQPGAAPPGSAAGDAAG